MVWKSFYQWRIVSIINFHDFTIYFITKNIYQSSKLEKILWFFQKLRFFRKISWVEKEVISLRKYFWRKIEREITWLLLSPTLSMQFTYQCLVWWHIAVWPPPGRDLCVPATRWVRGGLFSVCVRITPSHTGPLEKGLALLYHSDTCNENKVNTDCIKNNDECVSDQKNDFT